MSTQSLKLGAVVVALLSCLVGPTSAQSLTLNVDVGTGAANIVNTSDTAVSLDGYSITSPAGHLNGDWTSLMDQNVTGWDEADNSNSSRATEFNPTTATEIAAGDSLTLGTPYAPAGAPTLLGERFEDLAFQYTLPGAIVDSVVNYTGAINAVVLSIDPSTGAATIQNRSSLFNVAIDGYTITSAAGMLVPDTWTSLQDQSVEGWDEADNSDKFRVTEFQVSGQTQLDGGGAILDLGPAFATEGLSVDDLNFEYLVAGGTVGQGAISIGVAGPSCVIPTDGIPGDLDGDGSVAFLDFLALANNFGATNVRYEQGDIDCDGEVAFLDFLALANNFGTSAASTAAVPEPSAGLLSFLACLGLLGRRRR